MARTDNESALKGHESDTHHLTFHAGNETRIELPSSDFITDAKMTRDGDDLVLQTPNGQIAVIEGYFSADPAPLIQCADGSTLTPQLVHAFAHSPMEFATNETASDVSPVGKIDEVKGHVTITHADGTVETATRGMAIYENDQIQTDAKGAANIIFMDESTMAVSENARLSIDQYVFDPSTENGTTNFSMLRGLFVYVSGLIGRDDPDHVKIDTPVGSIGIRGTVIAGEIHPGGQSNISVLEGAIVVKNGSMETTLSSQFETVRLSGFNDKIESLGVLPAKDIATKFSNIGDIAPSLFSTINETVKEQSGTDPSHTQAPQSHDSNQDQSVKPTGPESKAHESPSPFASLFSELGNDIAKLDVNSANLPSIRATLGLIESHMESTGAIANIVSLATAVVTAQAAGEVLGTKVELLQEAIKEAIITQAQTTISQTYTVPVTETVNPGTVGVLFNQIISGSLGLGFSVSSAGDLNKDGFNDFLVTQGSTGGNIYVGYGGNGNNVSLTPLVTTLTSTQTVISGIGDFNGDGTKDYIYGQNNALTGSTPSGNVHIITSSDLTFTSSDPNIAANMKLGSAVSGVGDFNNDGFSDVIAAAPSALGGSGAVYYIAGNNTSSNLNGSTLLESVQHNADAFGSSISKIGDINGDGYSDFAVAAPGTTGSTSGYVNVYLGNNTNNLLDTVKITHMGTQNFGSSLSYLGDINGDGLSDFFIGAKDSTGNQNTGYIKFGSASVSTSTDLEIHVASPLKLNEVGGIGDFNGDGHDDFFVRVGGSSSSDTYVVFGKDGFSGTIDTSFLENSANASKLATLSFGSGVELKVAALGDVNGDGYDDFSLSNPATGLVNITYGRDTQGGPASRLTATADNQSLVGSTDNNTFHDNSHIQNSFSGGAGNDDFVISNTNFTKIDGGSGTDTIKFAPDNAALNFTNVNFEKMTGIEELKFAGTGQSITLTAENLFNLLKSSDNGTLKITGGVNSALHLDDQSTQTVNYSGSESDQVKNLLGVTGAGGISGVIHDPNTPITDPTTGTHYDSFKIGGYTLLIDQNIAVDAH